MLVLFRQTLSQFDVVRIQRDHLPNVVINEISLIEFRSDAEHSRTVSALALKCIFARAGRDLCLAVFSADNKNDLTELAESVSVDESVNGRIKSLFPYLERDVTRR